MACRHVSPPDETGRSRPSKPGPGEPRDVPLLDTRGLLCPIPVIRTQDRIKRLAAGDLLDVGATDPGALHDIPAWCRVLGQSLVNATDEGEVLNFRIEVSNY